MSTFSVRDIVRDRCDAIWQCLTPAYMSARDKNDCWIRTADEHYERTNFPNCIVAVDGKCIRMRKPNDSWISVFQLQERPINGPHGCARCRLMFPSSRGWACRSSSDADVFKYRTFGKLLDSDKLNIPAARILSGDAEGLSMPFVLVGDEVFALPEYVLRPYRNKQLTCLKCVYVSSSSLVFSPKAGSGRNQSPVRRPVWLWHTAF